LTVVVAEFWAGGWVGAAPSIFDDEWTPPKRSAPASKPEGAKPGIPAKKGTAPETKEPAAQGNVAGVIPGEKIETVPPVVSEPVTPVKKRLAVPGKAAQAQARKLLREVFAKELSEHAPEARRVLAERFLSEAEKAADQPVDEFVLLGGAYQAAREGNDLELCMRAIDEMAGTFEVDALDMKLGALSAISSGGDPVKARAAVMAGLKVLDEAVAVDDYDGAREAATRIEQAAARAGDASLAGYARDKAKEARRIGVEYERVRKEMLMAGAERDDRANGAIGRFLCFTKGDWQNGLAVRPASSRRSPTRNAAP
jgi:hypothetical protein